MADLDTTDQATVEEWAQLAEARLSLQSSVRRFLGTEEGQVCCQPKLFRRATYWFLRAVDHAVRQFLGGGLELSFFLQCPHRPEAVAGCL